MQPEFLAALACFTASSALARAACLAGSREGDRHTDDTALHRHGDHQRTVPDRVRQPPSGDSTRRLRAVVGTSVGIGASVGIGFGACNGVALLCRGKAAGDPDADRHRGG
jgi:hypothetical protein